MVVQSLHDKKQIADFLQENIYIHLYSLGDLDPFFWPYTIWFGNIVQDQIKAILLIYLGNEIPTILAFSDKNHYLKELFQEVIPLLPSRFYLHSDLSLKPLLSEFYNVHSYGIHYRMVLTQPSLDTFQTSNTILRLTSNELPIIQDLYDQNYPNNWFDPRMIETNHYYGLFLENDLISIAGIHVYSPLYKVAALGNITTKFSYRGKGYASEITAVLCKHLLEESLTIGLNVKADNLAALACYQKLGFKKFYTFEELLVTMKRD